MKGIDFPVFKTKIEGVTQKFNLNDPGGRKQYFAAKAGVEIDKLKKYLENNTFVAYLIGKKNSGKGTYSKLFGEVVGEDRISHLSVGDLVRDVHKSISIAGEKNKLVAFLEKNYRGFMKLEDALSAFLNKDQSTLIPSEFILALIKYEISKQPKKAIFIDGFPRALDQIGYSLFLKELIGYRDDPDFFVFIDLPESVIEARIKSRRICPKCQTSRNLTLLPTKYIGYEESSNEFYLMCDNPSCEKIRMVPKEGDELGLRPIRERLEADDQVFRQLLNLEGVQKIYLRNSLPADYALEYVDDYELTPTYKYKYYPETKEVEVLEEPWVIKDDDGVATHSLLSAPVALSLIKQTAQVLDL